MQLYTSLVRLKMAMNDGQLPPMTPLPESSKSAIDPRFTIGGDGYGGLVEDETKGLRCPVRGCGEWYQNLGCHVTWKHQEIGGRDGLCSLMGIPLTAPLVSARISEGTRQRNFARNAAGALARWRAEHPGEQSRRARADGSKRGAIVKAASRTVGFKNLLDACPAQLAHKLIDLQHQIGRSPTAEEARTIIGGSFVSAVQQVYGSWNNAKAQCGLGRWTTTSKHWTRDAVLESLRAWYETHGSLPSAKAVRRQNRAPLLMEYRHIMRAFNTKSWPEAMRQAAALLDIRGGRFGLPVREPATVEAA